jgi:ankyrin repeat protein
MPPKKKATGKVKKKAEKKPPVVIPPDNKLPVLSDTKNAVIVNAVLMNDKHSLSRLVAHYDYENSLNTTDVNGSTPIHAAVLKNEPKMMQMLLNYNKINVNALQLSIVGGQSALHLACAAGYTEMLDMLLKAGASPNIKSDSTVGETPLQLCCKLGRIECAKSLIKAGAHHETKDNFGNNASFWAYHHRQDALIRELGFPPPKSPNAEEFLALLIKQNPRFTLPAVKVPHKKKDKDGKGKGKKK